MLKFLIQTIDGEVVHDFAFELLRSIEYHKWRGDEMEFEFLDLQELWMVKIHSKKNYSEFIPIGTIEYVKKFIDTFLIQTNKDYVDIDQYIRPINVPLELRLPVVLEGTRGEILEGIKRLEMFYGIGARKYYIKSTEVLKDPINGDYDRDLLGKIIPESLVVQARPMTNIKSEWRVFVYQGNILACQNYSGDPLVFPNAMAIKDMVKGYTSSPEAYTLDVMVSENDMTSCLEVHEFFSCGFYGFSDYQRIPFMFARAWRDIKKRVVENGYQGS